MKDRIIILLLFAANMLIIYLAFMAINLVIEWNNYVGITMLAAICLVGSFMVWRDTHDG